MTFLKKDRGLFSTQQHVWCCGQTEVVLGSESASGVCACFHCFTWSTYRISISFHPQNTKSNPSEYPELFLSSRLCCQSDSLHGSRPYFRESGLTREPGQTWKDDSDSLAKLLFCRKVIQSQSNKITSSSLHNELFQIKQNEVFLSARPWTISSMLQCFSVNYSVITSWLYHWLKQQNSQTLKSADGWKKISVWFLLLPRNCGGPHRVSRYYSIPWWLRTEPLTNRS